MLKARIAVLVSGGGTNLQALIDAQKSGLLKSGEIVFVVANVKDAYALTRAANNGIEGMTVLRKECGGQEAFEDKLILGTLYTVCRAWRAWWKENGPLPFDRWTYEDFLPEEAE